MELWNANAYRMLAESDQLHAHLDFERGDFSKFDEWHCLSINARRALIWGGQYA